MLKGLNTFEKCYIIVGVILNTTIAIVSKSSWLAVINGISAVFNAIYMAKGKLVTFVYMTIETVTYIILSYQQHYYSEAAVNLFIHFPMMLVSLYTWFHHQSKETKTIKINDISIKELILSLLSQAILFPVYYFLFKKLGNDMLIASSINLALTLLALYYSARMSDYMYIAYITSSVIKTVLWLAPVLEGDFSSATVLIACMMYFVSDVYGLYSWRKLRKEQKTLQSNLINTHF